MIKESLIEAFSDELLAAKIGDIKTQIADLQADLALLRIAKAKRRTGIKVDDVVSYNGRSYRVNDFAWLAFGESGYVALKVTHLLKNGTAGRTTSVPLHQVTFARA